MPRNVYMISDVEMEDVSSGTLLWSLVVFLLGAICGGIISWGALFYLVQTAGGAA